MTGRQSVRANPQTTTVEDYYRICVYNPTVDNFIQNLSDRFTSNEDVLPVFQILLPQFCSLEKISMIDKLAMYFHDETSATTVKAEYELWCAVAPGIGNESEVLKVLEHCNPAFYRTIHYLLTVLATLPVSTASVERSFSTLKRVKTLLRNVMVDDRLSSLAMISTHWDIPVNPDRVIDIMAGRKDRRLLL